MRIHRTSKHGITYQASFREKPSAETLDALDAVARAAATHVRKTTPVPFCHSCGDQGGESGQRCGRDLSEELGKPSTCRGYYGLPLSRVDANQRARVETNFFRVAGGLYRWKHVEPGRIVVSKPLPYHEAKAQMEAWQAARTRQLMGKVVDLPTFQEER